MDKKKFLREQYLDVLASGAHICERWRLAFENFYDDLVDATPTNASRRFLMHRDPDIGFEPGNVEWHFRKSPGRVPAKVAAPQKTKTKTTAKAKKAAAASKARLEETRRREAERQKEERRKMIADQYRQWEEKRLRVPR